MKILFVASQLRYGGAEKMITLLANELAKRNFEIIIYTYENGNSNYDLNEKIAVIGEEKVIKNRIFRKLLQPFQVRRKVKKITPDIVISFLTNQNVFSVIGTMFRKTPVIISERGDPSINKGLINKIKYWFYNFADVIVFQTEDAKKYFNKRIQKKSIVIPNPAIKSNFNYNPINREISFVGRFEIKQKRQDIMINAFELIVREYPNYKLVFYGDGDDMDIIKQMVCDKNLIKNVIFKGKVDNILESISTSKVFVITSDYEGIPNVLIEAMSIGMPVVSTDCSPGGCRLLVQNNYNGYLTDKEDYEKVAERVINFIQNPDKALKFGNNAKKITETYSVEIIISKWINAIKKIDKKSKGEEKHEKK